MPELINLQTSHWTLSIWSKDITGSQRMLKNTLSVRERTLPSSTLYFNPLLFLTQPDEYVDSYRLSESPIFFENKYYEFEFQFHHLDSSSKEPVIKHPLNSVEDAFHYSGSLLRGSINFGNHVGWFKFKLCYIQQEILFTQSISFEVFPTKMDIKTDFSRIQQIIDEQYPLLRFSFAQKTEQELSRSNKPHERFPLLWLSLFESLRERLKQGTIQVLQSPHSRLLPISRKLRADQIKGKISTHLEEKIGTALASQQTYKRYPISTKKLSIDTPENRFIKMVLTQCTREVTAFMNLAKKNDSEPESARLSSSFFDELNQWKKPLEQLLSRPFFHELSQYEGLNKESLVLHQKAGYANVYQVWQQLKMYLDVFGHHAQISMKSIAELYEVWCVLEIRRLLVEELGFDEVKSYKATLYKSQNGFEKELREGYGAAFKLERENIKVSLIHEPRFFNPKRKSSQHIYSWVTNQKPDILLEAIFDNGEKIRWVFDAKYRISPDSNDTDYAPDDAINQMHRYRDALIYLHEEDTNRGKSHPIFGAFVLYPGWFEGTDINPYEEAITAVGIGAFPLLPNSENTWLRDFLLNQFGKAECTDYPIKSSDHYYVQEAARIGRTGMELSRYPDLTLAVSLGGKRKSDYIDAFRNGLANWYHIPVQTSQDNHAEENIMHELKHCAFIVYDEDNTRSIEYIYDVICMTKTKRGNITKEQSGSGKRINNPEQDYWLIKLGTARKTRQKIQVQGLRDNKFKFRLVSLDDLSQVKYWDDLPNHYSFLEYV